MNILFFIAHPSQYYLFKKTAEYLNKKHNVILVYFEKDVITNLIKSDPYDVETFCIKTINSDHLIGTVLKFIRKEFSLYQIAKKRNIQLFVGTSIVIAHIAKITGAKSIIFTEDDVEVTHLSAKLGYPFCNNIVSPLICNLGKWEKKGIKYNGYQKLAYLHPEKFHMREDFKIDGINLNQNFFLVRFSSLSAHHDIGVKGISDNLAKLIIKILSPQGKIFISSERRLPPMFEKYRLRIDPIHIHQILARAELLISDSQSMSVEAAMLGVPSIRFSGFAGKISVLEELEYKYGLTYGIKTDEPDRLLKKVAELSSNPDVRSEYQKRRQNMLNEKIDVNSFITNLIDKYPNSTKKFLRGSYP